MTEDLAETLLGGDRRALARAITLVESGRPADREVAEKLLERLLPATGRSLRIGISGAPGVGKSTFIEAFGLDAIARSHKVAVLAVDPTSKRSGGSILGDKTRMERLAASQFAFIRPSPSRGALGGVARRTREAMLLCEAAGFDRVIVETVGVGQSESAVADMVDVFMLLLQPGGGDELQGLKKGVIEIADLLVVTKADGELEAAATRAAAEYRGALQLLRPVDAGWRVPVVECSGLTGKGMEELWAALEDFQAHAARDGRLESRRRTQARSWMWHEVSEGLLSRLMAEAEATELADRLETDVEAGRTSPVRAARRLIDRLLDS